MTSSTDNTGLHIIRMINAPRERVHEAWTDVDVAMQWWGPEGGETEELVLDAWRGGRFRWLLNMADGRKVNIQGKYRLVLPAEKIVHTWQWIGEPEWKDAMSIVTIELLPKENNRATELRLTQEKLPNKESRDRHLADWNSALDRLERFFGSNIGRTSPP